jgi:hypothetical protein
MYEGTQWTKIFQLRKRGYFRYFELSFSIPLLISRFQLEFRNFVISTLVSRFQLQVRNFNFNFEISMQVFEISTSTWIFEFEFEFDDLNLNLTISACHMLGLPGQKGKILN